MPSRPRHGSDDRAGSVGGSRWPPVERPEQLFAHRKQRRPSVSYRRIEQQRPAFIAVALPWRLQPLVEQRRPAVHHGTQPLPGGRAERVARGRALDTREQTKFGDEAVVVRRELTVDTGRERIAFKL